MDAAAAPRSAGACISAKGLSDDGARVRLSSASAALVDGATDRNGAFEIFLADLAAGVAALLSATSDGVAADGGSGSGAISGDGTVAAVQTNAALAGTDDNGANDVYVVDLADGGSAIRASVAADGAPIAGQSPLSDISADGRFVVFATSDGFAPGHDADVFRVENALFQQTCGGRASTG
ncbi:MAG: hypothetical protein AAF192_23060 [Pseudomonadota bacterium]